MINSGVPEHIFESFEKTYKHHKKARSLTKVLEESCDTFDSYLLVLDVRTSTSTSIYHDRYSSLYRVSNEGILFRAVHYHNTGEIGWAHRFVCDALTGQNLWGDETALITCFRATFPEYCEGLDYESTRKCFYFLDGGEIEFDDGLKYERATFTNGDLTTNFLWGYPEDRSRFVWRS